MSWVRRPLADPFHVVKLANTRLDDVRRRTQQDTLGHRGHRDDPLYRSRKLLTIGHERLDDKANAKLENLLEGAAALVPGDVIVVPVDPHPRLPPAEGAPGYLDELVESLLEPAMSPELRQLGRTLRTWRHEICAWHQAQVSNGPTEATNNLIKVIKRIGFGFRRFRNYRLRVLLYAGRPNWDLLATLNPISPP